MTQLRRDRVLLVGVLLMMFLTGLWNVTRSETMSVSPLPILGGPLPVASLPSCGAGQAGSYFLATDALLPVIGSVIAGGGAIQVGVKCNGTSYVAI